VTNNVVSVRPLRETEHDLSLIIPTRTWKAVLLLAARNSGPPLELEPIASLSKHEAGRFSAALRRGLALLDAPKAPTPPARRASAQFITTSSQKIEEGLAFLAGEARREVEALIALAEEGRGIRAVQRYKDLGPPLVRGPAAERVPTTETTPVTLPAKKPAPQRKSKPRRPAKRR
jgi:hypothetical protein